MSTLSNASHACSVAPVRFNGSPDAKLSNKMAAMRLSPSACSSVGLGREVVMGMARDLTSPLLSALAAGAQACGPARPLRDFPHDTARAANALPMRVHRIVHETGRLEVRQLQAEVRA